MGYKQEIVALVARLTPQQQAYSALVLACGLLFWGLWGQIQQFRLEFPTQVTMTTATATSKVTLAELPKLHLLGKAEAPTSLVGIPNTLMQLSLKGIHSGNSPDDGSAIISVPGKTDRVYLVGDKLPGGAVLSGVYNDKVVIDRNGELEVVKFAHKGLEER